MWRRKNLAQDYDFIQKILWEDIPSGSETEFSDDGSDDDADFIPENNENLGKKYFVPTCTAYYVPVLYNSYSIYWQQ